MTTKLFTSGKFQVIERRLIENILKEQQLSMTGVIDEKTAMKVGSILGVDVIATGTTADLGTSIKINARTISVEKGSVISAASVMIPKNEQVTVLMGRNIQLPAEAINIPREQDISGTWKIVCCSGKYWGETDLTMDGRNKIKGQFYDIANKSGGTIEGTVNGNVVLFTRNKGEQDYKLTLSSDGKTMSGFFVGNHDGSVGTEVTMTRKNLTDLSPAEEVFTPWKGGDEFGREMDKYWKDGYYPAIVEGRNHEGKSEFRAAVQPFPKTAWWFYWWYDQLRSSYDEHRQKMIAEGFKEIHVQVFIDHDGMRKYQTCWIKLPAPDKHEAALDRSTQFKINKNGTVTDTVTQFMWQQVDDGIERDWVQATSYCENLDLGGHGGWRLPTTEQLKTIIDTTRENPSIDTTFFPNAKSAYYWSCATDGKVRSNAWVIGFHNGYMTSDFKTNKYYVRCVR